MSAWRGRMHGAGQVARRRGHAASSARLTAGLALIARISMGVIQGFGLYCCGLCWVRTFGRLCICRLPHILAYGCERLRLRALYAAPLS